MIWSDIPPEPSTEYESKSLGTWSSTTDVENFFNAHNAQNGFYGIKIGNYVTIRDGTYNKEWVVAGFNLEHNATASDGTTYDNGYGMLMIPRAHILSSTKWHTSSNTAVSYINSSMHKSTLVTAANNMKRVLGDHMIQRNVLLGSAQNNQVSSTQKKTTSSYTWTKSYLTLMSAGQCNGTFASHMSKYDDGEANYKLPLFDHESYYDNSSNFWLRGVWGLDNDSHFIGWFVRSDGLITNGSVDNTYDLRPLMLLR